MRVRRGLSVIAHVEGLREQHPELNAPVRAPQLRAVLQREGVDVIRAGIRRRAFVDGAGGVFVITMRNSLATQVQTKVLLHEYAHIHLHLTDEDGDVSRQLLACQRGDIREHEADLFAALLWYGPKATPTHPAIAPLFARVEGPGLTRKPSAQLALPLPRTKPRPQTKVKKPKTPWFGQAPVTGLRGVSHDALRFDWRDDGKPLGFFHYDFGWIKVYDSTSTTEGGRRSSVLVRVGDKGTRWREFVISSTERRIYAFRDGERRGRTAGELDRQILMAQKRKDSGDAAGQKASTKTNRRREEAI